MTRLPLYPRTTLTGGAASANHFTILIVGYFSEGCDINKSSNHFTLSFPTHFLCHQKHQTRSTKKSTKHLTKRTKKNRYVYQDPHLLSRPPTSLRGIPRDRLPGPNSRHSHPPYKCISHRRQRQNCPSPLTRLRTLVRLSNIHVPNEMESNGWLECQTSGAIPYVYDIVQAAVKVH